MKRETNGWMQMEHNADMYVLGTRAARRDSLFACPSEQTKELRQITLFLVQAHVVDEFNSYI